MLRLENLSVAYGSAPAVVGITLSVTQGEVVALVGANGSGRTTLLRTVSGLLRAHTGEVLLDGVDLTRLPPDRIVALGVAHVLQERSVFAAMSVLDNLRVGAHLQPGPLDLDQVHTLFPVLAERAGQRAGTLSGGEQAQLAFARALLSRPRYLLLDEPTVGLAPATAAVLRRAVDAARTAGVGVLLVDEVAPALELADRAVLLELGRVVRSGTAAELAEDEAVRTSLLG